MAGIRGVLGLLLALTTTLQPAGADPLLADFDYPHPVQHYDFQSQGQSLTMAFMDVRPQQPNGRTIVLLHGKNFCAATWEASIGPLRDEGYRVVVPDQIGFCKSSKPQAYQFSLHQLAANTHALLASIGVERPIVLGHSMGGMLAFRYALMYPRDMTGLIVVNPIGLEDWKAKGVPLVGVDQLYERERKTSFESIKRYQETTYYAGTWKPAYVRYFARYEARRLSAEQMYDSMITATHTEQPMATTYGLVRYANQLPDPTEPSTDSRVVDFMNQLGRGDWMLIDRLSAPTILGLLYQMNDTQNVNRSLGLSNANVGVTNRVHQIDADYPDDAQAIRRMFLASLTRYPTDQEMAIVMGRRSGPRYQWLSDLQWALLNKLDFAFN